MNKSEFYKKAEEFLLENKINPSQYMIRCENNGSDSNTAIPLRTLLVDFADKFINNDTVDFIDFMNPETLLLCFKKNGDRFSLKDYYELFKITRNDK